MNKLTLILVFFAVFFSSQNQTYAQYRQLRLAHEELEKINFDKTKVLEKIKKYEKDSGLNPESKYIRSKYLFKLSEDLTSVDSAYVYFSEAFNGLEYYDQKMKDELCKEISFCVSNKDTETQNIDLLIFNKYISSNAIDIIENYIDKYSTINYKNKAIVVRDSLEFDKIKLLNDELLLKKFLVKRPNSIFFKEVEELMYKVAFDKIKSSNSLEKYEEYVKTYPNSSMLNEAIEFISTKYWEIIDPKNNKDLYLKFISDYPKSKFIATAIIKIEEIDWKNSQDKDLLSGYEDFVLKYPNSSKLELANQKIKEFKELVLPYLKVNRKYQLFNIGTLQFVGDNDYDTMLAINNGLFIVSKYKKFGVIDLLGNKIIPCTYDCIQSSGDFFIINLGKNYGVINNKGSKIIDFAFDQISMTKSNRFIISKSINDLSSKYGLISSTGEDLLDVIYSDVSEIDSTTYRVSLNKQSYFVNELGAVKSLKYSSISSLTYDDNNMFFEVDLKGKKGLINNKGELIIPNVYESIEEAGDYVIVSSNVPKSGKLYGVLDKKGKLLIAPKYKSITFCGKNLFGIDTDILSKSNSVNFKLFDITISNFLTKNSYDSFELLENGLIKVGKNEQIGFISQKGEVIVNTIYQPYFGRPQPHSGEFLDEDVCYIDKSSIENISNDSFLGDNELILVQLSDNTGYINNKGEIIIPIIYSYGDQFYKGLTTVYTDGDIPSIIDSKGNVIMENAEILYYFNNSNYALAKQNNNFYKIDLETLKVDTYTLLRDMEYIDHYKKFKIIQYKGFDIYTTTKNQILMAKGIDFSDFEFNKKIKEARNSYLMGEYDDAISKLTSLNNEKNDVFEINLLLGQCYNSKNDSYRALEYFNSAIDIDPNNTVAYDERLEINYARNNWSDARNDIYKLIGFSTEYDEYLTFKLAYCCSQLNLNNEAFENYTKILKNNPKYSMAYNNRGAIYSSRGEHQLALNDYVNALKNSKYESNESKGLYLNNAANQCMKLNKKAEACAYWSKGAALDNAACINNKRYYCK